MLEKISLGGSISVKGWQGGCSVHGTILLGSLHMMMRAIFLMRLLH